MSIKPPTTYKQRVLWVLTVCTVISLVCIIGLVFSGPRIRQIDYNSQALTKDLNQTIVLRANQPLKSVDKSQVHIEPNTDFNVTTSGESVIIQLKQRLLEDTTYRVKLNDITGRNGRTTNNESSFKTGGSNYYYLKRNYGYSSNLYAFAEKEEDQIIKGSLYGEDEVVYSAEKILDFTVSGDKLISSQVSSIDEDAQQGTPSLVVYDLKTKESINISLPETKGTIDKLHTSSDGRFVGYTFTSKFVSGNQKYSYNLFIYDFKSKLLDEIKGIGNVRTGVGNWRFMPDGTTIVAETYTSGTLFIDVFSQHEPIPLGNLSGVANTSSNGGKIAFIDYREGPTILDVSKKSKNPYTTRNTGATTPIITSIRLLQNSEGVIKLLNIPVTSYSYEYTVAIQRWGADKELYRVSTQDNEVRNYSTTPNDQYLILETSAIKGREYDKYGSELQPTNVQTSIINTSDGKVLKTVSGSKLVWK